MSLSRSQLEAMNPSVLHSLADQVGSVHNSLAEQVQSHEQISRNLSEGWRGTSADQAAGDVDDHLAKMRSNAEGVAQLRTALSNAGNELISARSSVFNVVSQLESNGFRVGQDWSVQDASGKKGMQRSYAQRDGVARLRDSLTGFDQAQEGAGRATQAALGMIGPVSSKAPMQFAGGGGGGGDGLYDNCGKIKDPPKGKYDTSCREKGFKFCIDGGVYPVGTKDSDLDFLFDPPSDSFDEPYPLDENQLRNLKSVYCAGLDRYQNEDPSRREAKITIALMTVLCESGGRNMCDPSYPEYAEQADSKNQNESTPPSIRI